MQWYWQTKITLLCSFVDNHDFLEMSQGTLGVVNDNWDLALKMLGAFDKHKTMAMAM